MCQNNDTLFTETNKKRKGPHLCPHLLLTYGVLVFVRVNAGVHDSTEQVVHDAGQRLGVQHAVQRAHKHRLTGVQALGGTAHIVAVGDDPGDHLHLGQRRVPHHNSHKSCKVRLQSQTPISSGFHSRFKKHRGVF